MKRSCEQRCGALLNLLAPGIVPEAEQLGLYEALVLQEDPMAHVL